ncbi:MAG: phosphoesterase, partial [Acidobacteria bacterium]|nr:phosphoesterase [Acidobacteriota bacterium]
FFDESYVIPNPVVPDASGTQLVPYSGAPLTVGNELNKLAANVAIGRNMAGVHWRSDYAESLKLGEAIALSMLADQRACYNENFGGFSLTKFDGTTVTV